MAGSCNECVVAAGDCKSVSASEERLIGDLDLGLKLLDCDIPRHCPTDIFKSGKIPEIWEIPTLLRFDGLDAAIDTL